MRFILFLTVSIMWSMTVDAEEIKPEESVMPKELAVYLARYGLCESDFHSKSFACRNLGSGGYWTGVGIYPEYISGTMTLGGSSFDAIATMSLRGGIEKCTTQGTDCAIVNDLDSLEKAVFGKSGEGINVYDLIARIQLLGTIKTTEEFLILMDRNDRKLNYNAIDGSEINNAIEEISCNINEVFCGRKEYLQYMIKLPIMHMLFYQIKGDIDAKSIKESLSIGIWRGADATLSSAWTALETISFRVGHLRNAEMANSRSRDFYKSIQIKLSGKDKKQ